MVKSSKPLLKQTLLVHKFAHHGLAYIGVLVSVFMEIITVYPEDRTTLTNTLCGKNIQILNIKK
jgi:hypothetical protein